VIRFRFIAEEKRTVPRLPAVPRRGVTRQGYYAWRGRPPSARAIDDAALSERIGQIHDQTLGIYGAPRVHAELALGHASMSGEGASRLMRERGIFGAGDGQPVTDPTVMWITP
jgi:putative transposase